jgi:hypothetical protein
MRLPRRIPRSFTRQVLALAALLAQIVAAVGAPTLSTRTPLKPGSIPFPCQNHPCGCGTAEEGWAGDCCCFTLEQKLAWAESRGLEPPSHVRATVEARRAAATRAAAKKSCCTKPTTKPDCCAAVAEVHEPPEHDETANRSPALRWVAFVQKCRGESPAGLSKFDSCDTLAEPVVRLLILRPVGEFNRPADLRASRTSARPPTPPPRLS